MKENIINQFIDQPPISKTSWTIVIWYRAAKSRYMRTREDMMFFFFIIKMILLFFVIAFLIRVYMFIRKTGDDLNVIFIVIKTLVQGIGKIGGDIGGALSNLPHI